MRTKRTIQYCVYLFIMTCIPASGIASDLSFSLTEKIEYSDNIGLASTNEQSDTILNTGFAIDYLNGSTKLPTTLHLSISYRDYLDDSFDDQTDILGLLSSRWIINQRRLEWEFINRYRLVPVDIQFADTPDNQENVNYFSTGPSINIVNTRRSRLNLNLRYENFYFEETNEDREDYVAKLNWVYSLANGVNFGLHGVHRSARFKDDVQNENYGRNEYFLSLANDTSTYEFSLEVGQTVIEPESSPENDSELIRARMQKTLSRNSMVGLVYNKELSDFSTLAARAEIDNTLSVGISNDIFLLEEIVANYAGKTSWGGINLAYGWRDYDYADDTDDNTAQRLDLNVNLVTGPSLSYQLTYVYEDTEWDQIDRNDKRRTFLVRLIKEFGDRFKTGVSLQNINNDSNVQTFGYTENRATFDMTYRVK